MVLDNHLGGDKKTVKILLPVSENREYVVMYRKIPILCIIMGLECRCSSLAGHIFYLIHVHVLVQNHQLVGIMDSSTVITALGRNHDSTEILIWISLMS